MQQPFKETVEALDAKLAVLDEAALRVNNNPDLSDEGKRKQLEPITAKKLEAEKQAKADILEIVEGYRPKHDYKTLDADKLQQVAAKMSIAKAAGTVIDDKTMSVLLADLADYDLSPVAELMDRYQFPVAFKKENAHADKMRDFRAFEEYVKGVLSSSLLVYTYAKENLKTMTSHGDFVL